MKSEENFKASNDSLINEIEIQGLYSLIIKNKKIISYTTLLGIALSTIFSLSIKRTWIGTFQIVLNETSGSSNLSPGSLALERFSSFIPSGISSGNSDLKTEIEILKSPFVLKDSFKFIKDKKKAKKDFSLEDEIFVKWRDKFFNTELKERTTVLNVSLKDTDKELIVPALRKISSSYQKYSGKRRLRKIELAENYFLKQLEKYRVKSEESTKNAQEYAISQNLIMPLALSSLSSPSSPSSPSPLPSELTEPAGSINNLLSINIIEANRIKSLTLIKEIEEKLKVIKATKKSDQVYELRMYLEEPEAINTFSTIQELDLELERKLSIFNKSDISIKDLEAKKEILFLRLKNQLIGYFESKKTNENAKLKASIRPKGVINEYRRLLYVASRDLKTLAQLEDQFRLNALEKAKSVDPWELITEPSLWPYPYAPNRKLLVLAGSLLGFIFGVLYIIYNDRKKDLISSSLEVNKLTGLPLLAEFSNANKKLWNSTSKSVALNYLDKINDSVMFLLISSQEETIFQNIYKKIESDSKNKNCNISSNIKEASLYENLIIVLFNQKTKRNELQKIRKELNIQQKNILGFLLIRNND